MESFSWPTQSWKNYSLRVIPLATNSGKYNMLADEFIWQQSGFFLRFYCWEKPTLSFGKGKLKNIEAERAKAKKLGLDLIERPTGGKTVLHEYELTYSFACDISIFPGGILETYSALSKILCDALLDLGIKTEMKDKKENLSQNTICFYEKSSFEISCSNKKLVGSSQRRNRERLLQHGSILFKVNWDLWQRVWSVTSIEEMKKKITCLDDQAREKISRERLIKKILLSFEKNTGILIQEESFSEEEEKVIRSTNYKLNHFDKDI